MAVSTFRYSIHARETKRYGTVYDIYFSVDKKQKKLSGFKTKTAAKQAFQDYMERSLIAPKIDTNTRYLMYEDARRVYISSVAPQIKESSLYDFKHTASKYHDVFFKRKNLHAMTKQDIIAFQDWLWSQKKQDGSFISPKYALKVFGQFRAFYRWCIERYDVPAVLVSPPKRKTQRRDYSIWTQSDFDNFIEFVDIPKYKALFTTLFYSGLRVGEAQALKVRDYDGNSLFVHSTYTKKTTDGSVYKITETKNYKARRVPLPAPCRAVLDEWAKNRKPDDYMFGDSAPVALNSIRSVLNTRIERSGVTKIRIHDLRHSYVSLLISKGANFAVVASLIGDTLEQVIKTYAHSIEEDKITVINSIL